MPDNNNPSLELFRFVNVRNPGSKVVIQSDSPSAGVKRFKQISPVFLDETFLDTATFHDSLVTLAAAAYNHEDYADAETAFLAGDFIKSREELVSLTFNPNLLERMRESTFANEAALITFITNSTGIDITDVGATAIISPLYERLWNNLLFYAIAAYKNESLHNDIISVSKVIEMMKELILNPTQGFNIDSFVENLSRSYFVIPSDIIPSTFPALEAITPPVDEEYQRTQDRIEINTDINQLVATAKMLDNWHDHTMASYNVLRENALPESDLPDYSLYKKFNDPETPADDTDIDTWKEGEYNNHKTNQGLNQSLSSDLKTALNISNATDKLDEIKSFAEISLEADALADRLATFMKDDTLYNHDYLKKKINETIASKGKKLAALAPIGYKKQGLIGGSLFEQQGKDYSADAPALPDGGEEPFDPCKIKVLGTGDLYKVEQKLICFQPSEIAHIENIMSGEERKRSTRRAKIIETETITEIEKETVEEKDLKTTERYEMESQASKTVAENTAITAGVNVSGKFGVVNLSVDAGFSYDHSSAESNTTASRFSKEMTESTRKKVSERIKTTTRIKIIEEFEEKNEHNFTNVGAEHKVGIYRFIDKIYEAKLMNYGRRTFLQFMVPEPAAFYIQNMMDAKKPQAEILKPIPPDELTHWNSLAIAPLKNFDSITDENYSMWASIYKASNIVPPPPMKIMKGASEVFTLQEATNAKSGEIKSIVAEDGYYIDRVRLNGYVQGRTYVWINYGDETWSGSIVGSSFNLDYRVPTSYQAISFPISYTTLDETSNKNIKGHMSIGYHLVRTDAKLKSWKIATYNAILEAYQRQKSDYDQAVAVAQYNEPNYGNNPGILKEIHEREIKRCCMEELLNIRRMIGVSTPGNLNIPWGYFGAINNRPIKECDTNSTFDYPYLDDLCDINTKGRDVLFFEQAIDWGNQTYVFYPYFWGRKCKWKALSTIENSDPLFTKFLQSGFARVVVPLREGMEAAVFNFLKTGQVWNNKDMPSIGDQLYLDIIQEVKEATDYPENPKCIETWTYKIPTNLVILQSDDSPIEDEGLPCFAEEGCPG